MKEEQRGEYLKYGGRQHNEVVVVCGLGKLYHITNYKAHLQNIRLRNTNSSSNMD